MQAISPVSLLQKILASSLVPVCLVLFTDFTFPSPASASPARSSDEEITIVRHRAPASKDDPRDRYFFELLETALQKTAGEYGPFKREACNILMTQNRVRREVRRGDLLHLFWLPTSRYQEENFLPIRIPLVKGLLGYRIFLIRKEDKGKFVAVRSLEHLNRFVAGQGEDWVDMEILRPNRIKVVSGHTYEGLFNMLLRGRFDYFPKGVTEAYIEYEERKDRMPELFVEENLVLYYPFPVYFFVSKTKPVLAERLEKGLKLMIRDGSFDRLFRRYYQSSIDRAGLDKRLLLGIDNPILTPETPLGIKDYWYRLSEKESGD